MKQRPRIYYSDTQKALMWKRWKQGWTLNEIGRLFDRPHTSIQQIFVRTGGIQPAVRSRSSMALSLAEREEISRALGTRGQVLPLQLCKPTPTPASPASARAAGGASVRLICQAKS
jgi:hypothetical protein